MRSFAEAVCCMLVCWVVYVFECLSGLLLTLNHHGCVGLECRFLSTLAARRLHLCNADA